MSPCVDVWRAVKSTLSDLWGNLSRCNLLSFFLLDSDSNPMKEILPLCSGGSLTSLLLSLFCWKLPSWSFFLKESSFWIFVLLGQIWHDDSHFLSFLFSFFPIPLFFSLFFNIDLIQAKKSQPASWDGVTNFSGILQNVLNLMLLKIICWVYSTTNARSLVYF